MRIAPKPLSAYSWLLRPFFWNQKRKYGDVLEAGLLWARSPKLFFGVATLYGMIDRSGSPVDPALRSLVTVRVSQINGCRFCVDINSATLMRRGVSEEKAMAVARWRSSDLFDERERAVLAYAEAMTEAPQSIPDEVYRGVCRHFDEDGLVELTGLIAFQNMSAKFNSALGVPPRGFCQIDEATMMPESRPHPAE